MFNHFVDPMDQLAWDRHWKNLIYTSKLIYTECMLNFWSTPEQHSHLCRRHCLRQYHREPGRLQNSKQNFLAANGIMAEPASGSPKVSCFSPLGLFFHQKRQLLFDYILNVGEETKIIYPGTVIGQLSEVKDGESSERLYLSTLICWYVR